MSCNKGLLGTYGFLTMVKVAETAMYVNDKVKVENWQVEDSLLTRIVVPDPLQVIKGCPSIGATLQ